MRKYQEKRCIVCHNSNYYYVGMYAKTLGFMDDEWKLEVHRSEPQPTTEKFEEIDYTKINPAAIFQENFCLGGCFANAAHRKARYELLCQKYQSLIDNISVFDKDNSESSIA